MLYLNVDGLTNLAIAEGTICRFTRVVGSGLEGMAGELAERRGIALTEARALLAAVDLTAPAVRRRRARRAPTETVPRGDPMPRLMRRTQPRRFQMSPRAPRITTSTRSP